MTDYISREAAVKAVEDSFYSDIMYLPTVFKRVINYIPAADVIPVVRCKECKYYSYSCCSHLDHEYESHYQDYYCADGERRE